jgi:hypothetical protein
MGLMLSIDGFLMNQDKFGVWRIKMVSSWFDLSGDRIESVGDKKPISIPII